MQRGKFRPRLTELVQQNSSEEVESTSKSAIAALPDLENAVKILTKLKAVGPATASGKALPPPPRPPRPIYSCLHPLVSTAILCAAAPHIAPFMADEAVLAVPNLGKLDYTLKHYLKYAQKMKEKAHQLSALRELNASLFLTGSPCQDFTFWSAWREQRRWRQRNVGLCTRWR